MTWGIRIRPIVCYTGGSCSVDHHNVLTNTPAAMIPDTNPTVSSGMAEIDMYIYKA
jgi:hypothetical protein